MRPRPLLALLLLTAACAEPDADPSAEPPREAPPETTEAAPPLPEADADTVRVPFANPAETVETAPMGRNGLLVAIDTGQHEAYERMTFTFDAGTPGVRVRYLSEPPRACGSGRVVEVEGEPLEVQFYPAGAHTEAGEPTVPTEPFDPAVPAVLEAARTCDFEGTVTWVLGLDQRRPFRVLTLGDPPRVAVDLQR